MELNKIYNMDCLEGIKKIPDKSINAIITDPPYFLGMTHNGQKGAWQDLAICKPFWVDLIKEFKRVLTDTGCLYMFTDWRGYAFYYPIVADTLGIDNLLAWDKGSGPGNFYSFEHEFIIFRTNDRGFRRKGLRNIIREIPAFNNGAKKEDGKKVHPTQKPTALIRKLIQDSTCEGDTILDCFMGSGTTAIACMETGRNYIGFEISENYLGISSNRIEEHKLAYTE